MCRYIGLIWLRHSTNWRLSHWLWFSCRRIWSLLKELIKSCLQISKRFWIWLFIIKLKIISWSTLFRIRFFTTWLLIHKCRKCILSPSEFFWHRCIIISSCWLSRSALSSWRRKSSRTLSSRWAGSRRSRSGGWRSRSRSGRWSSTPRGRQGCVKNLNFTETNLNYFILEILFFEPGSHNKKCCL